jgi:hypothetical protein
MRIICIILLVCLIGIASVSALTVNPATAPAMKTINPTTQPTISAVLAKPVTAVANVWVTVTVNSVPAGAAVFVDGQSVAQGTTPFNLGLHPGSHTILLTLANYKDYTTTVNLQAGYQAAIDAELQHELRATVIRENLSAVKVIEPQSGALHIIPAAGSPAQDNTVSCISGQECLTLAEAGEGYHQEGAVCGYNGSVPKYCIGRSPEMTVQPGEVQAAVSIKPENTSKKVNTTHDVGGILPLSPAATPRILGAQKQVGFMDSIFGLFSGLFGQKLTCPVGTVKCGSGCVDTRTDSLNCGACDYTCFDPGTCCGGECVDLQEDEMNCGTCGMTCFDPAVCWYGNCDLEGSPIAAADPTQPVQELVIPATTPQQLVIPSTTPQELVIPTPTPLRTSPIVI